MYTNALQDEFKSAVGVMDIAGTGKHIKDLRLSELSYRTTDNSSSVPSSCLLKPTAAPSASSSRAQNRPVKIKRHPRPAGGPEVLQEASPGMPAGV